MINLMFACPTYGPVDSQAIRAQRAAIMHAGQHGVRWVGDASPERMLIDASRNVVVKTALEHMVPLDSGADIFGVFWADNDVILPIDAITRLAQSMHNDRCHLISGMYFQRMPPHWPVVGTHDAATNTFHWLSSWPADRVAPIDGFGFGCAITSLTLLRDVATHHDRPFQFDVYSEDLTFCRRAAALGYQPFVDTGVLCGHLMEPKPATVETFQESQSRLAAAVSLRSAERG